MRCAIFFFSLKPSVEAFPLFLKDTGVRVYIRAVEVDADNAADALDMARPRKGESVMNSHSLETGNK